MAEQRTILTLALAAAVVAACGGGGAPAGSASNAGTSGPAGASGAAGASAAGTGPAGADLALDQCRLLTIDEVGGAFETEPLRTGLQPNTATPNCMYSQATDGAPALYLRLFTGKEADVVFRSDDDNPSFEDVADVGDAALYWSGQRQLTVRAGGFVFQIWTGPAGDKASDVDLEALRMLGGFVVTRLAGDTPTAHVTAPPIVTAQVACDLLSADEGAAVLGLGPLTSAQAATPTFCYFSLASGEIVLTTYLDRKGGPAVWDTVDDYGGEHVQGLGDDAVWEAANGRLSVLKGGAIINVALVSTLDADTVLAQDRQLIEIMLTHL